MNLYGGFCIPTQSLLGNTCILKPLNSRTGSLESMSINIKYRRNDLTSKYPYTPHTPLNLPYSVATVSPFIAISIRIMNKCTYRLIMPSKESIRWYYEWINRFPLSHIQNSLCSNNHLCSSLIGSIWIILSISPSNSESSCFQIVVSIFQYEFRSVNNLNYWV